MTQIALDRISSFRPPPFQNQAIHFASQANSSEAARLDGQFQEDFLKVLSGNCIYLKNFLGRSDDMTILNGIVQDLIRARAVGEGGGDGVAAAPTTATPSPSSSSSSPIPSGNSTINDNLSKVKKASNPDTNKPNYASMNDGDREKNKLPSSSSSSSATAMSLLNPKTKEQSEGDELRVGLQNWGKHQMFNKVDNISPTFNALVEFLGQYFDTSVHASRLNVYKDGNEWKYKHHDSHAYSKKHNEKEDITIGLSFGHSRALTFYHEAAANRKFDIPQSNCDLFAFTDQVNDVFMHGVEKDPSRQAFEMPRLSLIVWGKRRNLTERNGGGTTLPKELMSKFDKFNVTPSSSSSSSTLSNNNNNNLILSSKTNKNQKNNNNNNTNQSRTFSSFQHQNEDGSLTDEAKDCVVDVAKSLVSAKQQQQQQQQQQEVFASTSGMSTTQQTSSSSSFGVGDTSSSSSLATNIAKKKKNRLQ